jgi:hypothetical protein
VGFTFERPDRVPGQDVLAENPGMNGWLNRAAFVEQPLGTFGNSGVGIARGPSFYNVDLGLDKRFDLGGTKFITIRVEAFNVLNHAPLGMPNRDINDPSFGLITDVANAPRILEFAAKFGF